MPEVKVTDEVIFTRQDQHFGNITELNLSNSDEMKLCGFVKIQTVDPELNKKIVSAIKRVLKTG